MATQLERITRLEARADELERRLGALGDQVNGGPTVTFTESVRGKLHAMRSALASADLVKAAAEAASRAQRDAEHTASTLRGRRLSTWSQVLLVIAAMVTAAAPYVLHFAG